jgi:cell division protein FtsX
MGGHREASKSEEARYDEAWVEPLVRWILIIVVVVPVVVVMLTLWSLKG